MPQFNPANLEGRDRLAHIEEYIGTSKSDWFSRQNLLNNGMGILAESYQIFLQDGGAALGATGATNTLALTGVGLRQGDVVSKIMMYNTAGGSGVTLHKYGLYTSSGSLLASSSDLSAGLSAVTTGSLSSSVTIPSDGLYYLGFLSLATVTVPSWVRASLSAGHGDLLVTGAARRVAAVATQSDISGNVTPASNATYLPWIACA